MISSKPSVRLATAFEERVLDAALRFRDRCAPLHEMFVAGILMCMRPAPVYSIESMCDKERSSRMFRSGFRKLRSAPPIALLLSLLFGLVPHTRAAQAPVVPTPPAPHTLTGIDALELENFAPLKGKRVGLITNQTGVDPQGRRTIDVLKAAPGVKLIALFSPEHGIAGRADSAVSNATDSQTGLTVYSLYGATRRPTPEMLANLDALVFDIQDAGVRFYTFTTTMAYCMEEAAKAHIPYYVLDRPNPLGGEIIEGPMLDQDKVSFVGYFPMPVRYAMTMGELAQMFNTENKIGADLHVITMKNWQRGEPYNQAGLPWVAPSPNLRSLTEAYLYPGVEILQAGGVSVGRGTDTPFEVLGAPWIDGAKFAAALSRRKIPGVEFTPTQFTPTQDMYAGQPCQGVRIRIAPKGDLRSMRMGLEIADTLHRMYPENFHLEKTITLIGNQATVDALAHGESPAKIIKSWTPALDNFRTMRAKYLLYH
jgi:uncharacterized protein YbbC (DUF1343 family)